LDKEKEFCQINKKEYPLSELMPGISVRPALIKLILKEHPDWNPAGYISLEALNKYRAEYINELLKKEKGEFTKLEEDVISRIKSSQSISSMASYLEEDRDLTFGERMADKIAAIGGSWAFIISFLVFIFLWMLLNSIIIIFDFDPYPYIFLNLVLSCMSAIQAPVILMSQNRQDTKDRARAKHDYQINLKAELEIQQLHEKIDHLLINQGQRLLQTQQIQIELMTDILNQIKNNKNA
jgi:uncharacterized membrane protein